MLLFKARFVPLILAGQKTQTRRLWSRPQVKEGSLQKCYSRPPYARPPGVPFATVRILRKWQEGLYDVTEEGGRAEGYLSREAFIKTEIEDEDGSLFNVPPGELLTVVEFELMRER